MQQIAEFLLHGCDRAPDLRTYWERTEDTLSCLIDRLFADYPNRAEFEEISGLVYACANALRPRKLRITRPRVNTRSCSLCCSSFQNRNSVSVLLRRNGGAGKVNPHD